MEAVRRKARGTGVTEGAAGEPGGTFTPVSVPALRSLQQLGALGRGPASQTQREERTNMGRELEGQGHGAPRLRSAQGAGLVLRLRSGLLGKPGPHGLQAGGRTFWPLSCNRRGVPNHRRLRSCLCAAGGKGPLSTVMGPAKHIQKDKTGVTTLCVKWHVSPRGGTKL